MTEKTYVISPFQSYVERFDTIKSDAKEFAQEQELQVYRDEEQIVSFYEEEVMTYALAHIEKEIDFSKPLQEILANDDVLGTSKLGTGFWNMDVLRRRTGAAPRRRCRCRSSRRSPRATRMFICNFGKS